MRVSFNLLTNSQDDGTSPWDVVAVGLQAVGTMDRLGTYLAEGGSKRHPLHRSEKGAGLFLSKRLFIGSGKTGLQSGSNVAQLCFTHHARIDADRTKC